MILTSSVPVMEVRSFDVDLSEIMGRNAQICFLGHTSAGSRSRRQHGYCGPRGVSNEKIYCKTSGQSRQESFGSKIESSTATPCRTAEWQAVDASRPCRMSRTSWARQAAEGCWRDRHRRRRRTVRHKLKLFLRHSGFCQQSVDVVGADIWRLPFSSK